jgi:CubicO group peptidase (beta-lactamase class C family)
MGNGIRSTASSLTIATYLLLGACGREAPRTELRPGQSQAIGKLLDTQMKASQIPGLAAAVMRNGVVVEKITRGLADVQGRVPVSDSTPFQLASTTKSFVSTGVLLLVSDARITLDTSAGEILTDLPPSWRSVTVRQLLSHTSGLPDIVRSPGQIDLIADSWDRALPLIADAPHPFAPGEKWVYTQTNYVLLAHIIERISGKPLETFLQERLFQPLAMKDTFYPPAAGDSPGTGRRCAPNYQRDAGGGVTVRRLDFPPFVHAAGGLCSSLADLIRWNAALDSGRVLRPDLATALWTATRLADGSSARIGANGIGYGLGWVVDESAGKKSVGHSGGNSTAYRRYLHDRVTIIVLHNGVLDPDGMVSSIASIVAREPGEAGPGAQERLWEASKQGDTAEIVRALHDGADIEALDTRTSRNGRRALNWAAFNNRPDAVRVLLERGAAIDATNKTGFTALHHAAEAGSGEVIDLLLASGANRTLVNQNGERAADVARRRGFAILAERIESGR